MWLGFRFPGGLSEVFLQVLPFPVSSKTNISKFQFDLESVPQLVLCAKYDLLLFFNWKSFNSSFHLAASKLSYASLNSLNSLQASPPVRRKHTPRYKHNKPSTTIRRGNLHPRGVAILHRCVARVDGLTQARTQAQ